MFGIRWVDINDEFLAFLLIVDNILQALWQLGKIVIEEIKLKDVRVQEVRTLAHACYTLVHNMYVRAI